MKTILVMAGGTGGHVFPALSVAKWLQDHKQFTVAWLGTAHGIEARLVPQAGFPLHTLCISGLRRHGILRWLGMPFILTRAIWQAVSLMRKIKPDVVLGMGGYASGPGGIAAWLCRIPLVIHEQNSIAGLTNKALSHFAAKVLQAFPSTFPEKRSPLLTGNPVRSEICNVPLPQSRVAKSGRQLRLLICGGSLGALALNEVAPQAIANLDVTKRPDIWHLTGEAHYAKTKAQYQALGLSARIEAFNEKMEEAYAWADLVFCRSGALTVTELAAAGVGSILVPYPYAVDDHQTTNAQFLVSAGAAILLPQSELTVTALTAILEELIGHSEKCLSLAVAAKSVHISNSTQTVAEQCLEVCCE